MTPDTELELLQRLFPCERYVNLFPGGMPMRACVRRQLDRLPAKDGEGGTLPEAEWAPAKPFCASECQVGLRNRAQLIEAGVPARTCTQCGSGRVGTAQQAECPGCGPGERAAAMRRGERCGPNTRLWTGEVPNTPIEAITHEEPARPAEEEDVMPKGKRASPCPGCKSIGTRCKAGCPTRATEGRKPEPVRPLKAAMPRRPGKDLSGVTLENLLEERRRAADTIAQVDAELRRRRDEIAKALTEAA